MITLKVFKRSPETKAFQRTLNRDITNRKSEDKLQKTRKRPNLVFQSQLRLSKFLSFGPFLRRFSTLGGSKKFSMGDMMMSKVFKRLPQIRAIQRTSNHDRTTDHSSFIDKSSNPPHLLLVLDHASLNSLNCTESKTNCTQKMCYKIMKNNPTLLIQIVLEPPIDGLHNAL